LSKSPWHFALALCFTAIALFATPLHADEILPEHNSRYHQLGTTEGSRFYLLHRPNLPALSDATPRPLLIVLHGFGGNPARIERVTGFSALAQQHNFLVAYPLGTGRRPHWRFLQGENADVDFLSAMVADIARSTKIDTARIFVTGISNGAQMSWRLGCVADWVAGIATVAGNYQPYTDCQARPLPVMVIHGTTDRILPYDGRMVQFSPLFWASQRAKNNGCNPVPANTTTSATLRTQNWLDCPPAAPVIFHSLLNFGHAWPSETANFDATSAIWEFFSGLGSR
jgi:polyhydroxybutyrate depolymerase